MAFMTSPARLGSVVALAVLVGSATLRASVNGPEVGKSAPPLHLSKVLQAPADARANGEALRGKVVVIDFWATWCGPCVRSIPHWNELVDAFKDKPVQFLAISDENEQVVAAFLKRTPIHSWVGLDGLGQSMRDLYRIEGIPTTVLVNQKGAVVAVTHPARLEAKDIDEILRTGNSSLLPPAERDAGAGSADAGFERVPSTQPVFEVSARRSGPLPAGNGIDCWEGSATSVDASGQYASVRQAILTLFDGRSSLLDLRAPLPTEQYDFTVRLPPGASHADREQAVAPMFRSVFGLDIRHVKAEREVCVLTVVSTNSPGLTLSGPNSTGFGSAGSGRLQLSSTTLDGLRGFLEGVLDKPMVNETGLTNHYDIRLKWKMSRRELLPHALDRQVLAVVGEPDAAREAKLSADQRRQLAAIRGTLTETELRTLPDEDRENIELLRAELAKPEDQRFQPDPDAIRAALREQLGLDFTLERRSMPVLLVEKAALEK
jgi:uncharacterized protein (TIGR03435 family)